MSTIAKVIGYVYLVAWLASALGLLDMYVCVGKPGSCAAQPHTAKKAVTV